MVTKKENKKQQTGEQLSLLDFAEYNDAEMEIKPATELMKKVARLAPDRAKMKQVFTPVEIQNILDKRLKDEETTREENQKLSRATRTNKKWVRMKSAGDYAKIYFYPSYTGKDGTIWYKMIDFSALYFVYHLADRMAMNVNLYDDKDSYMKSQYVASVPSIEDVAIKFLELDLGTVETTVTGIYIFTLKNPLAEDDYAEMVQKEEERRDKLHNVMRPAKMEPATYKLLLALLRQVGPKIRHLEKRDFFAVGQNIIGTLEGFFRTYYQYSDGLVDKKSAGLKLLAWLDGLRAEFAILQEFDAWDSLGTAALLGESLMMLRRQVMKDFKVEPE